MLSLRFCVFVIGTAILFASTVNASEILSVEPITYHSNGQFYAKDRVQVLCTDSSDLTIQTQAEDTGAIITTTIKCKPPRRRMNAQQYSYVPFGYFLMRVPIIIAPPNINATTNYNNMASRVRRDHVANSDSALTQPPETIQLLGDLRSNVLKIKNTVTMALEQRRRVKNAVSLLSTLGVNSTQKHRSRFETQDNTDSGSDPVPPSVSGSCGSGVGMVCSTTDSDLNDLTDWSTIADFAFASDALKAFSTLAIGLTLGNPVAALTVALPFILDAGLDLGGVSPLEEVMRNIQIIANALLDTIRTVDIALRQQQSYDQNQNVFNLKVAQDFQYVRQRLNIDEQNIRVLSNQTQILQTEIQRVVANDNQRFQGLSGTINQLFGIDSNLTTYLTQLDERESDRLKAVYGVMQKIVIAIESNSDSIEAVRTEKTARRIAAQFYHDILRNVTVDSPPTIGPLLPFADDTGSPPMSYAAIQALRNKNDAIPMASVAVQGTVQQSGTFFARETQITIACDPTYIANFSLSSINVDFIFRSLGPYTTGADHCFETDADAWFCNCILRVNSTSIQYSDSSAVGLPSVLFPFGWSSPGTLLRFDPTTSIQFAGCTADVIDEGGCGTRSTTAFYDVLADFEAQLQSICESNWVNSQVRIVSLELPRLLDVSTSPSSYAAGYACEPDYYNLTSSNSPGNATLAASVYTLLTQSFTAFFGSNQQLTERRLYGAAGQSTTRGYLGSRFPSILNAYKSYELEFGALLSRLDAPIPRLLRTDLLTRNTDIYEIDVTVNDQDTITMNLSSFASVPMNDTAGNLTVISNNALSRVPAFDLLNEAMLWMSPEANYTSDTRTHSAVDGSPFVFVDFKKEHLKYNAPPLQRSGGLNYLEYRNIDLPTAVHYGEGMPFNLSAWSLLEGGVRFDPERADSPTNYLRRVDAITGLCGNRFSGSTLVEDTSGNIPPPNFFCQVLDQAVMETADGTKQSYIRDGQTSVDFVARTFAYVAQVDIPKGVFLGVTVNTQCPESVNVTVAADLALVFVDGDASTRVKYSVCDAAGATCLAYGDSLDVPGTYTFATLQGQYFFQAWPSFADAPTASNRCYGQNSGKGISLAINRVYVIDSGLPDNVHQAVTQIVAQSQIQTLTALNVILDLIKSINAGYVDTATQAPIVNLNYNISFLNDNTDISDLENQFNANVQDIASTQSVLSTLDSRMNETTAQLFALAYQGINITNALNSTLNRLEDQINALQNALNSLGEPNVDLKLPKIGDLIKDILNILGKALGLPGLFGSLWDLVKDLVILGILVALCCVCFKVIDLLPKGKSSPPPSAQPPPIPQYLPMPVPQIMTPAPSKPLPSMQDVNPLHARTTLAPAASTSLEGKK